MKKLLFSMAALAAAGGVALPFLKKGVTYEVDVAPPSEAAVADLEFPRPETSILAVRFELPVTVLAAAANQKVPKDFSGAEEKNIHKRIRNGTIQYQIIPGEVALQNTGQNISFAVPIRGAAMVTGNFDAAILQLPIQGQAELGGHILGSITPQFREDWRFLPNLDPNLKLDVANLTLNRLGTISATKLVEQMADPMIKKETAHLAEGIDFKADVEKLWIEAHLNRQVSTEPPAWVVLDPYSVFMGPIDYSDPESISVTIGMQSQALLTNTPGMVSQPELLPDLQGAETSPVNDVRMPIIADLEELNKIMITQSFTKGTKMGPSITVTEPQIRIGRDGFLVLGIHLVADSGKVGRRLAGRIWMKAKPDLNSEEQTLGFTEVQLTRETLDALPPTAASQLQSQLISVITKQLKIDLKEHLPEVETEIQKQLISNDQLPEGIQLIAPKPQIELLEIYTVNRSAEGAETAPALVAVFGAKGEVIARLSSIPGSP